MNLKIGITGGIGAGKTFVAQVFKTLGIPYYNADVEAKILMNTNLEIRERLIDAFGQKTYDKEGRLNREYLASIVFNDTNRLHTLNSIVHPIVIKKGKDWGDSQLGKYSLKEAALLFESGSYKDLDYTILVTAPEELRIQRVMTRDNLSRDEVLKRIAKQMSEKDKLNLANFVIINDEKQSLLSQIWKIHEILISKK